MITFARAHQGTLKTVFAIVVLSVITLFIVNNFWPGFTGESWGWMMYFGSLPWSIAATAVPGVIGAMIIAVGLGFNVVVTTTVVWYVISWWLKTLQYHN